VRDREAESVSAVDSTQYAFPDTRGSGAPETSATRSIVMWDVVMLALGLGFFAAAIGYSYACERL
jgi:hypothetical protein